jgi:hypothetical protein
LDSLQQRVFELFYEKFVPAQISGVQGLNEAKDGLDTWLTKPGVTDTGISRYLAKLDGGRIRRIAVFSVK